MVEIFTLFAVVLVIYVAISKKSIKLNNQLANKTSELELTPHIIKHQKKEYLTTLNERKLCFALQKALDHKYMIHSQVSLIALTEPFNSNNKRESWAKRMDFVITDTATKIIAVIELDDSSHLSEKRIQRDAYVNNALENHHPLIRLSTQKFYDPKEIANILEEKAGIKSIYANQHAISTQTAHGSRGL